MKNLICPHCKQDELKPYKDFYCCYGCGEIVRQPTHITIKTNAMKTAREYRVVIDADNNVILHKFEADRTDFVLNHFKRLCKWNDVSVDQGGDIILWKD